VYLSFLEAIDLIVQGDAHATSIVSEGYMYMSNVDDPLIWCKMEKASRRARSNGERD
jgi:hypothetical protein